MGDLERPTWDTLAKVSTVAEQMRRRAEVAEAEATQLADAQNEYWATIERLGAQIGGIVGLLCEARRYVAGPALRHGDPRTVELLRRVDDALERLGGR